MAAIPSQTLGAVAPECRDGFWPLNAARSLPTGARQRRPLATVQVPVAVLMGRESAELFGEMAHWLAPRLNAVVITAPGGHAAYFDHAPELAETLRPILRRWSAP